jgi:hypothetical protein
MSYKLATPPRARLRVVMMLMICPQSHSAPKLRYPEVFVKRPSALDTIQVAFIPRGFFGNQTGMSSTFE